MSRLRIFDEDASRPAAARPRATTRRSRANWRRSASTFEQWRRRSRSRRAHRPTTVMAAYRGDIDRLVAERGFRSVDVVSIAPDNPEREAMRGEVPRRAFPQGRRSALLRRRLGPVHPARRRQGLRDPVRAGRPDRRAGFDPHWFDMGPEPSFVAIRFFTEPDGWVGHFTGTDIAKTFPRYEPGRGRDEAGHPHRHRRHHQQHRLRQGRAVPLCAARAAALRARARRRARSPPLARCGRGRERRHLQRRRDRRDPAGLDRPGPQAHRAEGAAGHDLARRLRARRFRGHVYPDAAAALRAGTRPAIALAVFSSGSVAAQKLLFGHSDAGDLAPLFSAFFDTEVGHKREPDSYRRIAERSAQRRRESCSSPTWSRNSTPRAKPACRRCCSTAARTIRSRATRMPATAIARVEAFERITLAGLIAGWSMAQAIDQSRQHRAAAASTLPSATSRTAAATSPSSARSRSRNGIDARIAACAAATALPGWNPPGLRQFAHAGHRLRPGTRAIGLAGRCRHAPSRRMPPRRCGRPAHARR